MIFEDFAWNYCNYMELDTTKHKYVWCEQTNQSCKKINCPQIKIYYKICLEEEFNDIIKDNNKIKIFQKTQNELIKKENKEKKYLNQNLLLVDGIPGPETKNRMKILLERITNENIY